MDVEGLLVKQIPPSVVVNVLFGIALLKLIFFFRIKIDFVFVHAFSTNLYSNRYTKREGGTHGNSAIWIPPSILEKNNLKIRKVYNGLMHISDWMPTLLYATNISTDEYNISFDGVVQWNNFFENMASNDTRQYIYYGTNNGCGSNWIINNTGIRVGDMKYLNYSGGVPTGWYPPPNQTGPNRSSSVVYNEYVMPISNLKFVDEIGGQLYNLTEDVGEYNNIAANNTQIVQQLYAMLTEIEQISNIVPEDMNCSNVTHPVYPTVGGVWLPWC